MLVAKYLLIALNDLKHLDAKVIDSLNVISFAYDVQIEAEVKTRLTSDIMDKYNQQGFNAITNAVDYVQSQVSHTIADNNYVITFRF